MRVKQVNLSIPCGIDDIFHYLYRDTNSEKLQNHGAPCRAKVNQGVGELKMKLGGVGELGLNVIWLLRNNDGGRHEASLSKVYYRLDKKTSGE